MITFKIKNAPATAASWRLSFLYSNKPEVWSEDLIPIEDGFITGKADGKPTSARFMVYSSAGVFISYAEPEELITFEDLKTYTFDYAAGKFEGGNSWVKWVAIAGGGLVGLFVLTRLLNRR
jgi:hypothetical protein